MSLYNSFDRSKHFEELSSPLDTAMGVLSPAVRKTRALQNLGGMATLQVGDATTEVATITTTATTAMAFHRRTSAISGIIGLTLTSFALQTTGDGAALAIGASLISFPTGTLVRGIDLTGTFLVAGNDYTNAVVFGLGTTIASGAVGVLNGTAAFHAVMNEQTSGSLAASGANSVIAVVAPHGAGAPVRQARLTTTTPGLAVFLNAAATWTNVATAGVLTFTGAVALEYTYLL